MRLRLEESASHAGGGSHVEDCSPDGAFHQCATS